MPESRPVWKVTPLRLVLTLIASAGFAFYVATDPTPVLTQPGPDANDRHQRLYDRAVFGDSLRELDGIAT
ncbi:hypothetical protein [Streptomyces sp. NPDC051219]|uniref:hypothetical protein n=1 Tax=Streptomyces sp. NPDC051219 TaxID=3155283 RepID=UPI0034461B26